jgi:hypothetical protein
VVIDGRAEALLASPARRRGDVCACGSATLDIASGRQVSITENSYFEEQAAFLIIGGGAAVLPATLAQAAFAIQLLLNAVRSPMFFGNHNLRAGLIVILLLVVAIAVTIVAADKVNHLAAALLLPYLAWTLFAAALNARIVSLN